MRRRARATKTEAVTKSQEFFEPGRACHHPAVLALVDDAIQRADEGRLKRRGREQDRQAFRALAVALVSNAAHALALGLEPPTVGIPIARPKGRTSRYEGSSLRQLDGVRKAIEPGLVTITPSRTKGIASVMLPGEALRECVSGLSDFGLPCFKRIGGETIIVRRVERDYALGFRETFNVDYQDTPATDLMRAELQRINVAIASANIDFVGPMRPDVYQRRLRRVFNTVDDTPQFRLNGRLHGGWWESVDRGRRHGIRIDGEPVADLDFSAMFLRLAYAKANVEPPEGDLYTGILGAEEGRYREGLKQVVNAMLSRSTPLTRLPKGCKELLPKGCRAALLREAILERHSAICDQFEAGVSLGLMRTESDILVTVLLRLIDRGIIALPMHDGLMVRHDCAGAAEAVMRRVSFEQTGFELPVKAKELIPSLP